MSTSLKQVGTTLSIVQIIDTLVTKTKLGLTNAHIDIPQIIKTAISLMQEVEAMGLKGEDKKQIVLCVIQKIVEVLPIDPALKVGVDVFVTVALPVIIDVVIDVYNGNIDIGELITNNCSGCGNICKTQ